MDRYRQLVSLLISSIFTQGKKNATVAALFSGLCAFKPATNLLSHRCTTGHTLARSITVKLLNR